MRLIAVLVGAHLVFLAVGAVALWSWGWALLAVEAVFVLSLVVTLRLALRGLEPLALLRDAADSIRESDFTVRYRETGHTDVDTLVRVYNSMTDQLREQRIHTEEQEQLLQRIEATSPAAMVLLDHDGRVDRVNPAGRTLLGLSSGDELASSEDRIVRRLADLADGDECVLSVEGRRRLRARRLSFFDRGFARSYFLIDELTEELRRSERAAYEKLIRMMAHEVNNTVGSVNSLLDSSYEMLAEDERLEPVRKALQTAMRRSDSMNGFMRSLADVVRVGPPSRAAVDAEELLTDLHRLFGAELAERDIECSLQMDHSTIRVPIDRGQFEHALTNVLRNAIESIDRGGHITIRSATSATHWQVEIEDDGAGIDEEAAEQLFTAFFTTKQSGQGVGLMLVQEILLGHGADFGLRGLEDGALFWLRVPLVSH